MFEERDDGMPVLGSVRDLTRYSAKSCLSTVDLKLVESSRERGNIYVFADPSSRKKGEEEEGRKKFLLSNYLTESANPRASPKDEKCKFIELFD